MSGSASIERRLQDLHTSWEAGSRYALREAFEWCGLNELPMPQWLYEAVTVDLDFADENRRDGPHGRTQAKRDETHDKHAIRHNLVLQFLGLQELELLASEREMISVADACRSASRFLAKAGSFARGSARAIEESYNLMKSGPGKV